jgi:peptidoglycan/xylan/chitin deacetylase (PgdA/CDA1 family)
MVTRRGRRPAPRFPWRRAAVPLTLLLAATLAAAAAVDHSVPSTHVAQRPTPLSSAFAWATPEDDTGAFVDPTPTAPSVVAAGIHGPSGPSITLPILLYHYIRVNPVPTDKVGWNLSVTPSNFARQMAFLHFIGAHTVSLTDALDALRTGKPLPPRSVVLTFDDGYFDFASRAAPVMFRDGLTGTVFVVSGFIGRNGYMTADQVRQVVSMGMTVGCHTVSHVALATVPLPYAKQQIDIAHSQLQALIGRPVTDFAYPYGSYDPAVENLVQADGFSDAVTTDVGSTLYLSRPYAWPRYRVGGSDTLQSFAHKALFGMPLGTIDTLLARFLASPAASATPSPSPTARPATALVGEDSRRYS